MDNDSHVGLVDAHAKGVGRHNDALRVFLPQHLTLVASGMFKTGMIKRGVDA